MNLPTDPIDSLPEAEVRELARTLRARNVELAKLLAGDWAAVADPRQTRALWKHLFLAVCGELLPRTVLGPVEDRDDFFGWCEACSVPLFSDDPCVAADGEGVVGCGQMWRHDNPEAMVPEIESAIEEGEYSGTVEGFLAHQRKCVDAPCFDPAACRTETSGSVNAALGWLDDLSDETGPNHHHENMKRARTGTISVPHLNPDRPIRLRMPGLRSRWIDLTKPHAAFIAAGLVLALAEADGIEVDLPEPEDVE